MGAVTVTRHAPALTEKQLTEWFREQLSEMARESGTDAYSGNWNANQGLRILSATAKTSAEAEALLEERCHKWGDVLAIRVGDFTKAFPESKADKALVTKVEELRKAVDEFDWHILDRAQKAKSRTRKCTHCESGINVHKMEKPTLRDYLAAEQGSWHWPGVFWRRGTRFVPLFRGLTDCPVCGHNLLRTETDKKAFTSLSTRLSEAEKKVAAAQAAYKAKYAGKPQPHWVVSALCGS